MAQITEQAALQAPHKLTLDSRSKLSVTGVRDVESFNENLIVLHTDFGTMIIRGSGLHLKLLAIDGGQVAVEGTVESLVYEDEVRRGGLLTRLFG